MRFTFSSGKWHPLKFDVSGDRKMPKCTTCERKGIECEFTRIPKKRGPNSGKDQIWAANLFGFLPLKRHPTLLLATLSILLSELSPLKQKCQCVLTDSTFLDNLVSVNAVNRLRDEIRKQKQLQAYYERQYNELLNNKSFSGQNEGSSDQNNSLLLNPMLMQNLLKMATKVIVDSILQHTRCIQILFCH